MTNYGCIDTCLEKIYRNPSLSNSCFTTLSHLIDWRLHSNSISTNFSWHYRFTHKKKNHTASCSKKITGEAGSLRWQSSTMCSSSLSSCCTSWTWCSFQPCPVGNQPFFSLCVCACMRVCVYARDAVELCCPKLSAAQTPHPRASSVDWLQRLYVACSDECYPDSLPECHQCNP